MNERRNDLEIMNWIPQIALQIQNSDRSPLYDVRNPAGKVCEDVACEVMFRGRLFEAPCSSIASIFDFIWWSQTGSNRRPHACKARALPAELWPRTRRRMLLPAMRRMRSIKVVGLGRLELPTSRLSSARSNQLSYKPLTLPSIRNRDMLARNRLAPMHRTSAKPLARVRPRRKRNVDGEIPPMQLNNPDDRWPLMFLKRFDRSKLLKNHP
jgi:hypothetical protein